MLLHKDGGENVAVKNLMSHFSMFLPTKATVKLYNRNTGNTQLIGVILYLFPKFSILYPVGPVYYCPGHPYNIISSGALHFYVGFKRFRLKLLNILTLLNLKVIIGYQPTRLKKIFTILKYKLSKSTLTETVILLSQLSVYLQNKISLSFFISVFAMSLLPD